VNADADDVAGTNFIGIEPRYRLINYQRVADQFSRGRAGEYE
jgi:hypothetical protein